jgi:hypothetical protein
MCRVALGFLPFGTTRFLFLAQLSSLNQSGSDCANLVWHFPCSSPQDTACWLAFETEWNAIHIPPTHSFRLMPCIGCSVHAKGGWGHNRLAQHVSRTQAQKDVSIVILCCNLSLPFELPPGYFFPVLMYQKI